MVILTQKKMCIYFPYGVPDNLRDSGIGVFGARILTSRQMGKLMERAYKTAEERGAFKSKKRAEALKHLDEVKGSLSEIEKNIGESMNMSSTTVLRLMELVKDLGLKMRNAENCAKDAEMWKDYSEPYMQHTFGLHWEEHMKVNSRINELEKTLRDAAKKAAWALA